MLIARALLGICLLAFPLSALCAESPPKGPPNKAKSSATTAATDKRGTDEVPLTVKVLPAPDAQAKAEQEQRDRIEKATAEAKKSLLDEGLVDWTRNLFIATIALAIFAAIQVALFWWQLRLIRDSAEDARKAADAAKESAEATKASVVLAEMTAKRQLRAYISCRARVDDLRETDEGFEVTMSVRNNGTTPAYSVQCWGQLQSFGFDEGQAFSLAPNELSIPRFVIHPRERHAFNVGTGLISSEVREDIRHGLRVLYLWGEIRYIDAFNDPHTTWFRMLHRVWTNKKGESVHAWVYTDDGNKAD
jgi:hypothetical protein